MTDPLKIMDEIESGVGRGLPISLSMTHEQWQSLRPAIEAQAEELAQARRRRMDAEFKHGIAEKDALDLRQELAQKEVRIARLQLALSHLAEHIWTEEEAKEVLYVVVGRGPTNRTRGEGGE